MRNGSTIAQKSWLKLKEEEYHNRKSEIEEKLKENVESLLAEDETIQLADGYEEAFMGIARQSGKPFAVYDRQKCIEILRKQGETEEEAEEYFQFNVEGAWVGENTPAFLEK